MNFSSSTCSKTSTYQHEDELKEVFGEFEYYISSNGFNSYWPVQRLNDGYLKSHSEGCCEWIGQIIL